ncbi:hypothetical protein FSP39_024051 [Pinctada imbricata]|uniref:BTB domain-containing protein n=1 Tax=Pinctada imbricata TaxID=66713 RepID=A0AA89BJU3_PINIB|nr:hypothetical protein FSP39_024051 [Pinctada imbricata]
MERFKLNVGGTVFEISQDKLAKYPETFLGKLTKTSKIYEELSDSFFIDRNPEFFNSILDLYRLDVLHLPSGTCGAVIRAELEFWEIPLDKLCQCCQREYFKYERELELIEKIRKTFAEGELKYSAKELHSSKFKRVLNRIWLFFDQPKSSVYAKVFSGVFLMFVLMSLLSFVLGSIQDFRFPLEVFQNNFTLRWLVEESDIRFFNELNLNNAKEVMFVTTIPKFYLLLMDLICAIFFTFEFLLHFLSCPMKLRFFTYPLNVIDAILVVCMISLYILDQYIEELINYYYVMKIYLIIRALLVMRLFRLFRFLKIYSGFRILVLSIRSSLKEFCLLFFSFVIASVIFASLIYYAEFHTPNTIPDIPSGIWWSIVTMTTVGYGDFVPKSGYGYVVGTGCAFVGLIILALPIALVATNFNDFYDRNKERKDREKLEREIKQNKNQETSFAKVAPLNESDFEETIKVTNY